MPLKCHMACMTSSRVQFTSARTQQPLLHSRAPAQPHYSAHQATELGTPAPAQSALTSRMGCPEVSFLLPLCSLHPLHTVLCSSRIRKNLFAPTPVPWPSHLPGTGVLCTQLGSGRRNLCPGPRRYPHSHRGSGSRGRGLQGHRGHYHPSLPPPTGFWAAQRCLLWATLPTPPPPSPPPPPGPAMRGVLSVSSWPASTLPISQCRPEKPGGQSHLYLPM